MKSQRVTLTVKSDSVSALIMAVDLKSRGYGPNLIAKEMALDIAELCYRPDCMRHVPGLSNVGADSLSRLMQPDSPSTLPVFFDDVERVYLKPRGRELFRTLNPP